MATDVGTFSQEDYDRLTQAITFLLAGLHGATDRRELHSISLQRDNRAAFRCILRGIGKSGPVDGLRLVAFTNADSAAECLLHAEYGFASDVIRWHLDAFANGAGENASAENGHKGLVIAKKFQF